MKGSFCHLPQVLKQMQAIRHLKRFWRSLADAQSIFQGPIASDDFDPGVLLQSGCQGCRFPAREQVDDMMPFQVDEDRLVATPLSHGPVVDTQNTRFGAT